MVEFLKLYHLATFERGGAGQCLYMLLLEDPAIKTTMRRACVLGMDAGQGAAAFAALYLWLYWERKNAKAAYASFAAEYPQIREVENVDDFEHALLEIGELHVW